MVPEMRCKMSSEASSETSSRMSSTMHFTTRFTMRPHLRLAAVSVALATSLLAGCDKKKDDTGNLKSAINSYYQAHPECLFPAAKKLPAQADTDNDRDTAGYDALVDQGLLVRTTAEKTRLLVLNKQVNMYDLSDKGRGVWKADPQQPGYGNFCYGHRAVEAISSSTPAGSTQPAATTVVNYTYTIAGVADWARAASVQTAFPAVRDKLAASSNGHNTLGLTANGWQLQAPAARGASGDAGIVE